MDNARKEILSRIPEVPEADRESEYARIERSYRQSPSADRDAVIECFLDRLQDYGCGVYRCSQNAIASTIQAHARPQMLISGQVAQAWLPEGIRFLKDKGFSYQELDGQPGVLTGCAIAIALTGTIILNHNGGRRALTLIPDYHLCVVFEDQVTETVPEAIRRLNTFGNSPITTIAGPSATADIEMTRIKGVHGPRSLDVILVESPDAHCIPQPSKG